MDPDSPYVSNDTLGAIHIALLGITGERYCCYSYALGLMSHAILFFCQGGSSGDFFGQREFDWGEWSI
jgi:hypothetical protein